jgi:hypothetical protein
MALNVLSACHSIGTLSNSTIESSSRSRLDWRSSSQPKRLTSSSANGVQVLRVCDSYPGPMNGYRAEFNKEVWPQSARNYFTATEYLLPKERDRVVRWSSYTLIHMMLPPLHIFSEEFFRYNFQKCFHINFLASLKFSNFVPSRRNFILQEAKATCRRQTRIRPAPPSYFCNSFDQNEAIWAMLKSHSSEHVKTRFRQNEVQCNKTGNAKI